MRFVPIAASLLALALAGRAAAAGGDVQATVVGGKLQIVGDDADNDVEITQDGFAGTYVVTGRNGTTVNGGASANVTGVRAVNVRLLGGDDVLAVTSLRLRGGLRVDLGDGADIVVLSGAKIRGRSGLVGGLGDDRLAAVAGSVIHAGISFRGGEGNDTIEVRGSTTRNVSLLDGGNGDDAVFFTDSRADESLKIRTGDGEDEVQLENSDFEEDVDVGLGDDDDRLLVDDCDFERKTTFDGDDDRDDIDLRSGNDFDRAPRVRSFED